MKTNASVYFMALKYCFEKRYIVMKKILYWLILYYQFKHENNVLIFATKNIFGQVFWAPIAVNCYQIEPGYVPALINSLIFNLQYLFVSLNSLPCLTLCHAHVWSCFSLVVAMFTNIILSAHNSDVISNRAVDIWVLIGTLILGIVYFVRHM